MANTERGEVDIQLGARTYVLKPSFDAIANIENWTGKSIQELLAAASNGTQKFSDLVHCVRAGMLAAGNKKTPSFQALGQRCLDAQHQEGGEFQIAVYTFMANCITGGRTRDAGDESNDDDDDDEGDTAGNE